MVIWKLQLLWELTNFSASLAVLNVAKLRRLTQIFNNKSAWLPCLSWRLNDQIITIKGICFFFYLCCLNSFSSVNTACKSCPLIKCYFHPLNCQCVFLTSMVWYCWLCFCFVWGLYEGTGWLISGVHDGFTGIFVGALSIKYDFVLMYVVALKICCRTVFLT